MLLCSLRYANYNQEESRLHTSIYSSVNHNRIVGNDLEIKGKIYIAEINYIC